MILIADSGSTKCDWVALDQQGEVVLKTKSKGLNPSVFLPISMQGHLAENDALQSVAQRVRQIYFYGAGCGTLQPKKVLEELLTGQFPKAKLSIHEDILGACYAVAKKPSIVCILGTGSNACYFDGKKAHLPMPSLGYSIMDEASGNYFGKQLIRDYYYKKMPIEIAEIFAKEYDLSADVIKQKLYQESNPNTYLAHFAEFIFRNKEKNPTYFNSLLTRGIEVFVENRIITLNNYTKLPIHFVGSIAYFAQEIIANSLKNKNLALGNVLRHPIDGLIAYHRKKSI